MFKKEVMYVNCYLFFFVSLLFLLAFVNARCARKLQSTQFTPNMTERFSPYVCVCVCVGELARDHVHLCTTLSVCPSSLLHCARPFTNSTLSKHTTAATGNQTHFSFLFTGHFIQKQQLPHHMAHGSRTTE